MPMYTFHCPACNNAFERFLRPIEAIGGASCPACGEHTVEQTTDGPVASPGPACDLSKKT